MQRLHTTNSNKIIRPLTTYPQEGLKPFGLWYGLDQSWIQWCKDADYDGIGQNLFTLDVDLSKIKVIENYQDLIEFQQRYKQVREGLPDVGHVDWNRVADDFHGIEIRNYHKIKNIEFYTKSFQIIVWFYGWDCDSGCVWNFDAIKSIKKEL